MTIDGALNQAKKILVGTDSPALDAQILLCHVFKCQLAYVHAWPDQVLTGEQKTAFELLLAERQAGKPIAHIIGERGFWSFDLKVTSDTLIPRPDTELLVELALARISPAMTIADLGTGSGAIALALAKEHPDIKVIATDYSTAALKVAKENAEQLKLSNIFFCQGYWCQAITSESFDLIVSNPPYIEENDPHLLRGDIRFEPVSALASGPDGLNDIREIVTESVHCLKSAGWLLIEHGYHQSDAVTMLFAEAGFKNIIAERDLGGQDRVVLGQLPV